MKLKNDPYFPILALTIIAALFLSLLNSSTATPASAPHVNPTAIARPAAELAPADTLTATAAAITHAE